MAQRAYNILGVDPNAIVVSAVPQGSSAYQWMDGYLAAGGGAYADVIAFHGYVNQTRSSQPEHPDQQYAIRNGEVRAAEQAALDTEASWGQNSNYSIHAEAPSLPHVVCSTEGRRSIGTVGHRWGTLWW